jgi:hypothetical protein
MVAEADTGLTTIQNQTLQNQKSPFIQAVERHIERIEAYYQTARYPIHRTLQEQKVYLFFGH